MERRIVFAVPTRGVQIALGLAKGSSRIQVTVGSSNGLLTPHSDRVRIPFDGIWTYRYESYSLSLFWLMDDSRYQGRFPGRNCFKKPQASNGTFHPARPSPLRSRRASRGSIPWRMSRK